MKRNFNIIVIALLLALYSVLAYLAYEHFSSQSRIDNGPLKISDFVSAAVAIAAAITGCVAAVFSYNSLRFAQKAEEGELYLQMMARYSSPEMADAFRTLRLFWNKHRDNLPQAFRDWKFGRDNQDEDAQKVELARHKVKYYYRDLMQMYQAGYFSKDLTKRILNTGGREIFLHIVLKMEGQANLLQFEKEFFPFERFCKELDKEQVKTNPPPGRVKTVCLIPARYDSTRYDGKLMKLLGSPAKGQKTVIRVTYERIKSHKLFDRVAVVTNSLVIKQELEKHGADVIYIDKKHESGTDRIAEAVKEIDAEVIVNVQGDEPFVEKEPLKDLLRNIDPRVHPRMVCSLMRKMDKPDQIRSSDFVKVVCDKNDLALYFGRSITPYPKNPKVSPDYYEHIGVYAFTRDAILEFAALQPTDLEKIESVECLRFLENGIPIKMVRTNYPILEIDTEEDRTEANNKIEAGEFTI